MYSGPSILGPLVGPGTQCGLMTFGLEIKACYYRKMEIFDKIKWP